MIKRGLMKTLAEVGKIKTGYKGEMKESAGGKSFQPPKKLDYFIITTTVRDPKTGNLVENKALMEKLPKNPEGKLTEIKIRLPFDSVDKNFFTQFQAYNGGKRVCSGDGEKANRKGDITVTDKGLSIKGDEQKEIECNFETCPIACAGKCKVSGILSCFLPDSGDFGGVYKYRTHSWNGVSGIMGALEFFAENTGGILQGLPLKLVLLKKTTEEHGTIVYCTVVLDGEEMRGLRKMAIAEKTERLAIGFDMATVEKQAEESGFFEDKDDAEEVEQEFYTEGEPVIAPKEKGVSGDGLASLVKQASGDVEDAEMVTETAPEPKTVVGKPVTPKKETAPVQGNVHTGITTGSGKPVSNPTTAPDSTTEKTDTESASQLDIF